MDQHRGRFASEEQIRIGELQEPLIDQFLDHREALQTGDENRAKTRSAALFWWR